jgi:hypothetical protein
MADQSLTIRFLHLRKVDNKNIFDIILNKYIHIKPIRKLGDMGRVEKLTCKEK